MSHHTALIDGLHADPADRPALLALSLRLEGLGYNQHARESIVGFAAAEGTPSHCTYLDPADEAEAEAAFVGGLDPVPETSEEWDVPVAITLLEPARPEPIEPPDDWPDAPDFHFSRIGPDPLRSIAQAPSARGATESVGLSGYE
jgi:hypothetical protein